MDLRGWRGSRLDVTASLDLDIIQSPRKDDCLVENDGNKE